MSSSKPVDANYRYIAAGNELNVRIGLRQQQLALYTTLVLGLLAALVALRPEPGGSARVPIEWLALGFPVASLCLVLLNYKTESALTHLRRFLAELEQIGNAHQELPSYNSDPAWAAGTNGARRLHDYSAALLVAAAHAVALGALWRIYPGQLGWDAAVLWIIALSGLAAVTALLWLARWSYRPLARRS